MQVKILGAATEIEGSIQHRDEAEFTEDLWEFSGFLRDAFDESEADKVDIVSYIEKLAKEAKAVEAPPKCRVPLFCKK